MLPSLYFVFSLSLLFLSFFPSPCLLVSWFPWIIYRDYSAVCQPPLKDPLRGGHPISVTLAIGPFQQSPLQVGPHIACWEPRDRASSDSSFYCTGSHGTHHLLYHPRTAGGGVSLKHTMLQPLLSLQLLADS